LESRSRTRESLLQLLCNVDALRTCAAILEHLHQLF
jgi:hypothetical protein